MTGKKAPNVGPQPQCALYLRHTFGNNYEHCGSKFPSQCTTSGIQIRAYQKLNLKINGKFQSFIINKVSMVLLLLVENLP